MQKKCILLCLFCKMSAVGTQTALVAFGFAGLADVAAVKEKPVMRFWDDGRRNVFDEGFLRLQRVLAVGGEAESFADAEEMRIHGHCRLIPDDCTDHIRSFASYALERLQIVDIIRHLFVVDGYKTLRHQHQMFRF